MKNGKCPKCNSDQIFVSSLPFAEEIVVRVKSKSLESFPSTAYLCVDCRYIEIYTSEISTTLFGKGKSLKDSIAISDNWKKVSA
jgi:predicted nucleic-acid-binding Zn-ribbon protein